MKSFVLAALTAGCFATSALNTSAGVGPPATLTPFQETILAAAKTSAALQFNGPRVAGVQVGTPFLHSLAVTGDRPLEFSATGLPAGLRLDPATGIISGAVNAAGEFAVTLRASNSKGNVQSTLKIVAGDTLALTPPMGWNSYDAFGDSVREDEVLANTVWLKQHLQPYGWDTIVVDFRWYDSKADGIRNQNPEAVTIDEFGRCIPPTNRFPSAAGGQGFKPLADKIHAMGLKFGIHIMRGIPRKAVQADTPIAGTPFKASQAVLPEGAPNRTCGWRNSDMFGVDATTAAGKAWYANIAKQYAEWGVDYIKCDDISRAYVVPEIEALSQGLRASGRSIVLSLSPGPTPVNRADHVRQFANLWRISGDFWDNWAALNRNFGLFANWLPHLGRGQWADGDMIPFGHICQRNCDVRPDRWTRFTPEEQVTLMSLWALAPSPLMLGMNLPDNDAWTTAILTNPELLAVNQDPLGRAAKRITDAAAPAEAWIKVLADGSSAVGFFSRTNEPVKVDVAWSQLGFAASPQVRDLWLHKDLGHQERFTAELPVHGAVLLHVQ